MKKQEKALNAKKSDEGLTIVSPPGESEEQAVARVMLSPALQSARTLKEYMDSSDHLELQAMIDSLERQVELIETGDFKRIDQMLLSQAHTLDAIANNLFRRAKKQEYTSNLESCLKLGLRAQNQCRTALEALLRAKNPKTHLNQTNIAHNQQINNRLGKAQSKLSSEEVDGERLDPETPQEAVRGDQTLETVGAKHRSTNKRRQG